MTDFPTKPRPIGKLEPQYAEDFLSWQQQPTPEATGKLLTMIDPVIRQGVQVYLGGTQNAGPAAYSHARRLAVGALKTYDPYQARLGTHLMNHLQGLKRIARQSQQILRVPDRMLMDQAYMHEQSMQMEEELGREPSTQELSDHTGLSLRRLQKVRQLRRPVASGTLQAAALTGEDSSGYSAPAVAGGPSQTLLEAVYGDLGPTDQLIMEAATGMHGASMLPNHRIATKLRLSPGAVSQHKALIQAKINEMADLGFFNT